MLPSRCAMLRTCCEGRPPQQKNTVLVVVAKLLQTCCKYVAIMLRQCCEHVAFLFQRLSQSRLENQPLVQSPSEQFRRAIQEIASGRPRRRSQTRFVASRRDAQPTFEAAFWQRQLPNRPTQVQGNGLERPDAATGESKCDPKPTLDTDRLQYGSAPGPRRIGQP